MSYKTRPDQLNEVKGNILEWVSKDIDERRKIEFIRVFYSKHDCLQEIDERENK